LKVARSSLPAPLVLALGLISALLSPLALPPLARASPPRPPLLSPMPSGPMTPVVPSATIAPTMAARRATGAIVIDGRLGDPAWASAPISDHFIQQFPDELAPPGERTLVRVLYDKEALYIGVDCTQVATPVDAPLTRRDRVGPGDRVTVDIASRADGTSAAHFGITAAGVLDDGIYFNDADYSATWDENWEGAAAIGAAGWSAEFRIPFRILRIDRAETTTWGFQVQRFVGLRNEWDMWAFRPRTAAGIVSTFGTLTGIEEIGSARPIELRPAILGRVRHRDGEARTPYVGATDVSWSPGLDVRLHPTAGTTLDLAFNPDFGQVDADQVVLNLSTYEVLYPEKRPFFLEGLDIFATPRLLLYTRRIGARPADPTIDVSAEAIVDSAEPARLWAAAKWVGGWGKGTSVGVLSVLSGENDVTIRRLADGTEVRRPADPTTLFDVIRLQRRLGAQTDVGMMATATNRLEHPGDYPRLSFRCPNRSDNVSVAGRCDNDAYVGALDVRWRSPAAIYSATGQLVGSVLQGGPPRPAVDGIAVVPGHPGLGGNLTLAKQGGRHWLATLSPSFSGTQLEHNDVGYLERKNEAALYADVTYRTVEPWAATVETGTTLAVSHKQTFDSLGSSLGARFTDGLGAGLRLEDNLRLSTSATFTNFWAGAVTAYLRANRFDDRETGDGMALERAGVYGGELWFASDSRRRLSGTGWGQLQRVRDRSQIQMSGSVLVRPLSRLDVEIAPSFGHVAGEPRFIAKDGVPPVYYFGQLEANNVGVTVRATLGLTTRLTLQSYGQVFLATKHFSEVSRVDPAGAVRARIHLADLQPGATLPASIFPDARQTVLNVNLVLRWEFRLGSILYFVYTRAQLPAWTAPMGGIVNPGPVLSPAALGGNRAATDTLMLKIAYWWG